MERILSQSTTSSARGVPVSVFVSSRYEVAVQVRNVFRPKVRTANSRMPQQFAPVIFYQHGS